jgi:hypothetical protein
MPGETNPFAAYHGRRALQRLDRLNGCFDAERRQALQQLLRNQAIGTEPAEHYATRVIAIEEVPRALIPDHAWAGILRQQLRATMTTAQQPSEQHQHGRPWKRQYWRRDTPWRQRCKNGSEP